MGEAKRRGTQEQRIKLARHQRVVDIQNKVRAHKQALEAQKEEEAAKLAAMTPEERDAEEKRRSKVMLNHAAAVGLYSALGIR